MDRLWALGITLVFHCLRLVPARRASDFGDWLSRRIGPAHHPSSHSAALDNLRRIRPEDPESGRAEAVARMWGNVGRLQAETAVIEQLWDKADITVHGGAIVTEAVRARRPIVFVFPHLGNWELLGFAIQQLGATLNVVYELLPDKFELELALKARAKIGYRLITPNRNGVRDMLAALGRKEAVALAIDEFKDHNVVAPAFGRAPRADTNALFAAKLARRFDALVIPMVCARTAPFSFSISFLEALERPTRETLDSLCEGWVREHVEQWYMLPRLRLE